MSTKGDVWIKLFNNKKNYLVNYLLYIALIFSQHLAQLFDSKKLGFI